MVSILNSAPLHLDGEWLDTLVRSADLDSFPAVSDFALELRPSADDGLHIVMTSRTFGDLAGFPEWDHADRDLRHFIPQDVPIGSIDAPYADAGDSWRIIVFEVGGWVHVLEGNAPYSTEFRAWFRVPRDRYLLSWAQLIQSFNPLLSLEEWLAAQNQPPDA